MRASVIIRSKDEADRLRLTLASLACARAPAEIAPAEIIVVNDGSTDHTEAVIAEAARTLPIIHITHETPRGRSAAANAGAAQASGEVLIFLDGDTLAAADFTAAHLAVHAQAAARGVHLVARGETHHLRGTRFFADPEAGTPQPGQQERLGRMGPAELARMRVTRRDIAENFAGIDARSSPGIYPGAGPRLLYELEMAALRAPADCGVLWAAASGANQSVSRAAFLQAGGFDPALTINEHRELALRLCQAGARMVPVAARSYHLTHRSGWRDPLADPGWEAIFYRRHPIPAVALLSVLWASLAEPLPFAPACRITSLAELAQAAQRCGQALGLAAVRQMHFAGAAPSLGLAS